MSASASDDREPGEHVKRLVVGSGSTRRSISHPCSGSAAEHTPLQPVGFVLQSTYDRRREGVAPPTSPSSRRGAGPEPSETAGRSFRYSRSSLVGRAPTKGRAGRQPRAKASCSGARGEFAGAARLERRSERMPRPAFQPSAFSVISEDHRAWTSDSDRGRRYLNRSLNQVYDLAEAA